MAEWLSLDELSKYLKIPKSSLYKLIRVEGLPGHKLGRGYRFDREEVDAWVKGRGVKRSHRKKGGQQ